MGFLMPCHPLTNFEIQKIIKINQDLMVFFQEKIYCPPLPPPPKKDGAYVINLDEYADVGTYWIALFCNRNEIVYFDSFGVEHVPEKIKEFIGNKNIR